MTTLRPPSFVSHVVGEGAPAKWGRGVAEGEGIPVANLPPER
jgi:hypothetical protein